MKFTILIFTALLFSSQVLADPVLDLLVTENIYKKLAMDKSTEKFILQIDTTNGLVKIAGIVPSEKELAYLVQSIQSTVGVRDVDIAQMKLTNNLQLSNDSLVTAKISGILRQEKLMNTPIQIYTNNGIVTLRGTVANKQLLEQIIKFAKSIKGVKFVESELKVINPNLKN